jgi:hypothetical protein
VKRESFFRYPGARWTAAPLFVLLATGLLYVASCATSSSPSSSAASVSGRDMSTSPPSPDPRIGLRPGRTDAGEASWHMRLVSNTPSPEGFAGVTNSDLAFTGNYVIQGNYNGFVVWDAADPRRPTLRRRTSVRRRRATSRSSATCCSCRARGWAVVSTAARRVCRTR